MKKELNLGKAGLLIEKLIKDTEDNMLRWQKDALTITSEEDKKHAGEMKGYIFSTDINETLSAHISNFSGNIKVWVERNGERVYVQEELYTYPSIVSAVNKLNDVVNFFSDIQLMKEIDEYLGVPFDEKAYLINEGND